MILIFFYLLSNEVNSYTKFGFKHFGELRRTHYESTTRLIRGFSILMWCICSLSSSFEVALLICITHFT